MSDDGGYTETLAPLSPATWWVQIQPATAKVLERNFAGTVIAMASHVLTGPYHAGITTQTVVTFGARTFNVIGVANPGEMNEETVCVCAEVAP